MSRQTLSWCAIKVDMFRLSFSCCRRIWSLGWSLDCVTTFMVAGSIDCCVGGFQYFTMFLFVSIDGCIGGLQGRLNSLLLFAGCFNNLLRSCLLALLLLLLALDWSGDQWQSRLNHAAMELGFRGTTALGIRRHVTRRDSVSDRVGDCVNDGRPPGLAPWRRRRGGGGGGFSLGARTDAGGERKNKERNKIGSTVIYAWGNLEHSEGVIARPKKPNVQRHLLVRSGSFW